MKSRYNHTYCQLWYFELNLTYIQISNTVTIYIFLMV